MDTTKEYGEPDIIQYIKEREIQKRAEKFQKIYFGVRWYDPKTDKGRHWTGEEWVKTPE